MRQCTFNPSQAGFSLEVSVHTHLFQGILLLIHAAMFPLHSLLELIHRSSADGCRCISACTYNCGFTSLNARPWQCQWSEILNNGTNWWRCHDASMVTQSHIHFSLSSYGWRHTNLKSCDNCTLMLSSQNDKYLCRCIHNIVDLHWWDTLLKIPTSAWRWVIACKRSESDLTSCGALTATNQEYHLRNFKQIWPLCFEFQPSKQHCHDCSRCFCFQMILWA